VLEDTKSIYSVQAEMINKRWCVPRLLLSCGLAGTLGWVMQESGHPGSTQYLLPYLLHFTQHVGLPVVGFLGAVLDLVAVFVIRYSLYLPLAGSWLCNPRPRRSRVCAWRLIHCWPQPLPKKQNRDCNISSPDWKAGTSSTSLTSLTTWQSCTRMNVRYIRTSTHKKQPARSMTRNNS
jgi:hypothetical protein